MSNKKSYMGLNNILSEGFFDSLLKIFKRHPELKNNKKIKNDIKDLNKKVSNLEKMMNDELAGFGSKKKIKLKPHKLSDFVKDI
jgi:hypothetical protein